MHIVASTILMGRLSMHIFFFFNDTATTEIYTLSLHDALPICSDAGPPRGRRRPRGTASRAQQSSSVASVKMTAALCLDRKSTRLNSSHGYISYAVFCLKKKKKKHRPPVSDPYNQVDTSQRHET